MLLRVSIRWLSLTPSSSFSPPPSPVYTSIFFRDCLPFLPVPHHPDAVILFRSSFVAAASAWAALCLHHPLPLLPSRPSQPSPGTPPSRTAPAFTYRIHILGAATFCPHSAHHIQRIISRIAPSVIFLHSPTRVAQHGTPAKADFLREWRSAYPSLSILAPGSSSGGAGSGGGDGGPSGSTSTSSSSSAVASALRSVSASVASSVRAMSSAVAAATNIDGVVSRRRAVQFLSSAVAAAPSDPWPLVAFAVGVSPDATFDVAATQNLAPVVHVAVATPAGASAALASDGSAAARRASIARTASQERSASALGKVDNDDDAEPFPVSSSSLWAAQPPRAMQLENVVHAVSDAALAADDRVMMAPPSSPRTTSVDSAIDSDVDFSGVTWTHEHAVSAGAAVLDVALVVRDRVALMRACGLVAPQWAAVGMEDVVLRTAAVLLGEVLVPPGGAQAFASAVVPPAQFAVDADFVDALVEEVRQWARRDYEREIAAWQQHAAEDSANDGAGERERVILAVVPRRVADLLRSVLEDAK